MKMKSVRKWLSSSTFNCPECGVKIVVSGISYCIVPRCSVPFWTHLEIIPVAQFFRRWIKSINQALISLLDSYRTICFCGGGAKVTEHRGTMHYKGSEVRWSTIFGVKQWRAACDVKYWVVGTDCTYGLLLFHAKSCFILPHFLCTPSRLQNKTATHTNMRLSATFR